MQNHGSDVYSTHKERDSVERCFWNASFVPLSLFAGTHFWNFVHKFVVHLCAVYTSEKLARPLQYIQYCLCEWVKIITAGSITAVLRLFKLDPSKQILTELWSGFCKTDNILLHTQSTYCFSSHTTHSLSCVTPKLVQYWMKCKNCFSMYCTAACVAHCGSQQNQLLLTPMRISTSLVQHGSA